MNKKGMSSMIMDAVIYLILTGLFVAFLFTFVNNQKNGAVIWEDFYAKEIAKALDSAEQGDEISLDVHTATEVASKNEFLDFKNMIKIDNGKREVIVKLGKTGETRFSFFNDIEIKNYFIELGVINENGEGTNVLRIKIAEKSKGIENG